MKQITWQRIGIGLLAIALIGVIFQIAAPHILPLPVYMELPGITLIDQDGQDFNILQTRGKVVVANPIFTNCMDICPITTAKMKKMQDLLRSKGYSDEVQFVTFSVDPGRDTPQVLREYAERHQADLSNWVFLTGTKNQINDLVNDMDLFVELVYYVDKTPVPESQLDHSPAEAFYLVNHTDSMFLVDREGFVRDIPPGSRSDVPETMEMIEKLIKTKTK